jgi:gliding motility-associated-like protein
MSRTILHSGHVALTALCFALATTSSAQLTVSPQSNVQELAAAITGPGVRIANPTIDCNAQGFGEFDYTGTVLGFDAGVILTTGRISNAVGPNNAANRTFEQGTTGNALLNTVTGRTTFDACKLEFDVIPGGDTLRFNFAFASEEYNEWVGSQYNDVFGFFISGPGIVGDPGIGNDKNIALIPNTQQAVTINNVNNGSNQAYYFDNAGGQQVQYDGITRQLQAVAAVEPCQTYRLKLIVADASDRKFDSGVFIERIQSNAVTMQALTTTGYPDLVEGCHPGSVRFTRQLITADPLDVPYFLTGSATNGVDYPLLGDVDPTIAKIATIPAGQSSVDVVFDPIADGLSEGDEYIRVLLGSSLCPGYYLDSLDIIIQDSLVAEISDPVTICPGGSTTLLASGGLNYSWSPATGLSAANVASPTASPASTTTYTVVASVASCTASATTSVTVSTMSLSAVNTRPLCQGQTNGAINLNVTGGTAPFSFAWTGPNSFSAASEDLVGIGAGTYTVTVTDGASCSVTQSFNLSTPAALALTTSPSILPFGQNISCFGGTDGSIDLGITGGSAPYQIVWSGPNGFASTNEDINSLSAGEYTASVTDANGCTANASRTLVQPPVISATITDLVPASCSTANDGSATVSLTGGIPPYSYQWSTAPVQISATASGLAAGSFTCTITDGYGCSRQATAVIPAPASLSVSVTNVSDVFQCQGQQNPNGSATAVVSGGTAPYSYAWSTVPAQTAAVANFNSGGTYAVQVSDANGCTGTAQVTVMQPGQSNIGVTVQNNVTCGALNSGSATVAVTGGSNVQSVTWNTVPVQSGATASGLTPGTYTATAQHADGCQSIATITITGPALLLSAAIDQVQGVSCFGGSTGEASASASGGVPPYSFSWNSTPVQSTSTATGLSAGPRTVTVTDALGCTVQASTTIPGPATALQVGITGSTNVLCFEGSEGSANAQASGGTAPYSYGWNSTPVQNGANATGLAESTYTVTAIDANGCTASTNVNISAPQFEVLGMVESFSDVTCFGDTDGSASISITGGSGSYSINWMVQPPQSGTSVSGLAPGEYMVEILDNNGCTTPKLVPFTISGPSAPLQLDFELSDYSGFNTSCHTSADGSIDVTVSGGYTPYSYQWTDLYGGINGSEDLSGLEADSYTLLVIDARGCTIDSTLVLTAPPAIVVDADVTTATCQGSATGSIAATLSGGIAPLDFSWSGPNGFSSTSATISDLEAGIYTISITDGNGCAASFSYDVSEPGLFNVDATLSSFAGGWNVSCSDASDGVIDLSVSGGTGALSYAWSGPGVVDPAQQDQSGLTPGTYSVTITDENGCSTLANYTLSAPAPLSTNLQPGVYNGFNTSCSGAADGNINTTISGGTVLYDISWSGPDGYTANTASIFDLAPGIYTITVSDENGCTTSASRTLVAPTPLATALATSTSTSGDAIACFGASTGSLDLTVSGGAQPYTTAWSGPNGFANSSQDISNLEAGTYAVTVSDANGCTEVLPIVLTEPTPIEITTINSNFNGSSISCDGASDGSITTTLIGGAGNFSFVWSGPNGFTSNDQDLTGLGTGNYVLSATDANGCVSTSSVTLEAPEPVSASLVLSDFNGSAISCNGATDGSITITISGGTALNSIAWVGPNGFASTDSDLVGLEAGSYTATVSDANGCTHEASATLSAPQPLAIDLDASLFAGGNNVSCAGAADGAVDLTASGGTTPFTFAWSDGLGFTSSDEDINGIGAGIYEVIVTDANGCSANGTITLNAPAALDLSATLSGIPGTNIACAGATDGSIVLDVSGGAAPILVQWNTGATGPELANVGVGTYTATVSDANGCTTTGSYVLEAPESVDVTVNASQHTSGFALACATSTDGTIDGSATGGTPDYDYAWTGPNGFTAAVPALTDLSIGTYTLVVTDANGCTGSASITLDAPQPLSITASAVAYNGGYHITCMGESNGQASAVAAGGVGIHTYVWSGPDAFSANSSSITGVIAGTYEVTVSDENGCSATATIDLNEPDALDVDLTLSDVGEGFNVGCDNNDGSISLTVSGGTPEHTYSWTNNSGFGSADANINGLGAGVYHLSVLDANGCVFETNATLVAPEPIAATFTTVPTTCPGDATGSISVVVAGGAAPYQFDWTGANGSLGTDQDLAGIEAGAYALEVTDALGCSSSFSTQVQGPDALSSGTYVSFYGQFNLQCSGDTTGVIELDPAGGTAPYAVSISGPNGFASSSTNLSGLVGGNYLVNIVDANGCAMDTTITLTQPELSIETTLDVSIYASGTNVSCFGGADGWIEATVNGGVGPYEFSWRGPDSLEFDTPNITGLTAGDYAYELVVTDGNQCSFFTEVTLTQPDSTISAETTTSGFNGGYQVSCAGASDGSIDLVLQGGNGGFTVDWISPAGTTLQGTSITDLGAGNYTATITDINGCTLQVDVVLNAPVPMTIALDAFNFPGGTQISCADANDGSISATIGGGTEAYSLVWSGPENFSASTTTLNELAPGNYCLVATDANGCTQNACIALVAPEVLAASATATPAACGENIGTVDLSVTGGSTPYAFQWANGSTTQDLSAQSPGINTVTITDANGCTTATLATVTGTPAVLAEGVVTNNVCSGGTSGSIELSVTSGTAPFDFLWSTGETSASLSGLEAGTRTVTISDNNGCTFTSTFLITENAAITIDAELSQHTAGYNISTWGGNDGSISTTVSGGTAPYSYSWSNGSTATRLYSQPAGTYTLEVTDANGCTASIIVVLTQPDDLIMPTGYSPNGDGANDTFFIRGLDAYPSNTFVVLNRWGNVVYDRLNYRNDWNGENIQGQMLPNGTYFVILTVNDGARTLQGYVDLRR